MEHRKLDALMTPIERIARVAAAGLTSATSSVTKPSGAKSYDNADGTRTIIGNVANGESNTSYTMATHVGDVTAPGTPTGVTASSKSGVVVVEWDGTLTGGVPDDFYAVRVYLDGSELGILTGAGSVSSASLDGGTTHSVTATAEDDACLPDGTPAHNVSAPTTAISVTVSEDAESVAAEVEQVRQDVADFRDDVATTYATKVEREDGDEAVRTFITTNYTNSNDLATTYATKTLVSQTRDAIELAASQTYETQTDAAATYATKSALTVGLDGIRSEVAEDYQPKGNYATTASMNSAIQQSASSIESSVAATYETKSDAASTYATKSSVNGKADASDVTALAGRVTTAESNITQNAQNIELKVSKDGVISSINQSAESVTINANKINLVGAVTIGDLASATQDAVLNSNLQVGGRNLLTGTADYSTKSTANQTGITVSSDTFGGTKVLVGTWSSGSMDMGRFANALSVSLRPDSDYTLSFWAKATAEVKVFSYLFTPSTVMSGENSSGNTTTASDGQIRSTLSTEWERYWVTWHTSTAASQATQVIAARVGGSASGKTVYVAGVKFEHGNKPTDWTPAPEDVDAAVSDAAKTATNYIVADSSGIKIADANPASSTTYQHQTSSGTDFVVNGGVRNRVNADGMTLYDGSGVADSNIFAKFASQLIELGRNSINSIIKLCNGVGKISVETGTTTTMRIEAESTSEINAHTYISKSALDLAQAYGAAIGGFIFKDSISTANRLSYATVTARDTGQVEIDTQRDDGSTQHLQFDDSGLAINSTKGIRGINFGYSASVTNQNGIVTFNPGMGVKPTAVFVTHALASNETNDVAKIAVPFVWAIDSATQVQVRWKRTDSNDYLRNNAVGWYWLAIY